MYFAKKNEHTIPLFIDANPLTLKFLYYKRLSELMHDVRKSQHRLNYVIYLRIRPVFIHTTLGPLPQTNFYVKRSRLEIQKKSFFKNRHKTLE